MNELEKQLAELVRKGIEVAEKTGEFVIEQAPDLLQEFYKWHLIKNIFVIVALLLVMIILWKIFKYSGLNEDPKGYTDYVKLFGKFYPDIGGVVIGVFGSVGFLVGLGFIITCVYNIVFILSAPKLYLIEYFIK